MNMSITNIPGILSTLPPKPNKTETQGDSKVNFSEVLKSSIEKVNESQLVSDQKTEALTMGKVDDLHEVMIAAQKASITLETTVQIQKKVIDAYNEIMRMQV